MLYKPHGEASLRRWRAFWRHDVADRPPMVVHYQEEQEWGAMRNAEAIPEDFQTQLEPEFVARQVRRVESRFADRSGFPDDTFPQVLAPNGSTLAGWAFGSRVEVAAGIYWVTPVLERIQHWRGLDLQAARRRFERVLEVDRLLIELCQGRLAISAASLSGVADMVVRMLGEEKLALALYKQPDEVEALFSACAEIWKEHVGRKLALLPTYGGGTATAWYYWAPGKGMALQEDFGQMISPRQFRQVVLKHDRHFGAGLDCIWFHVHSGGMHMAKEIADSGAFHGVQITNDYPAGPTPEDMLPTLRHIQKRTCLILRKFTLDQLDQLIPHLSPEGLAIDIQCYDSTATDDIQTTLMTQEEGLRTLAWAEDWTRAARI